MSEARLPWQTRTLNPVCRSLKKPTSAVKLFDVSVLMLSGDRRGRIHRCTRVRWAPNDDRTRSAPRQCYERLVEVGVIAKNIAEDSPDGCHPAHMVRRSCGLIFQARDFLNQLL